MQKNKQKYLKQYIFLSNEPFVYLNEIHFHKNCLSQLWVQIFQQHSSIEFLMSHLNNISYRLLEKSLILKAFIEKLDQISEKSRPIKVK